MYRNKLLTVPDRIVSFYRPYVRPVKRGKEGGKKVEFGPKAVLSHVDGFLFLDKLEHDNFSEAGTDIIKQQVSGYRTRFKKKPLSVTADTAYGSRDNRDWLQSENIRAAFRPLGRRRKVEGAEER